MEFPKGSRVRLHGLSTQELNGAIGHTAGVLDSATGRIPVKLVSPPEAVCKHAAGINVKPDNLQVLQHKGVKIAGWDVSGVTLTPKESRQCAEVSGGWHSCPVPTLLGIPLALCRLTRSERLDSEQIATYLLIDKVSGFAPNWVQTGGLGPVLVARTDGEDLTEEQLFELHDYNCRLMDLWSEWEDDKERQAALTPAAYQRFTEERRAENELNLNSQEDDEDTDDDADLADPVD